MQSQMRNKSIDWESKVSSSMSGQTDLTRGNFQKIKNK